MRNAINADDNITTGSWTKNTISANIQHDNAAVCRDNDAGYHADRRSAAESSAGLLYDNNTKCKLAIAISYIINNYHKDISRDDIASEIQMNPSYFSHLFKARMGQSYVEYLRRLRIEKAKYLLEYTNDYEVYIKVGYNSSKYFAKVFRRQTGYTPCEYKRMVRCRKETCVAIRADNH